MEKQHPFFTLSISENKKNYFYVIIEIGLISLFLLLTIILAISNKSIWLDEAYSLAPIRYSWQEFIRHQSLDVHPPLYFFILKLCMDIFGKSLFIARLVSILPSILTMIFGAIFLKKEFSHKSAIIFLLCFIASDSIVHHSLDIRMYTWALFFVTMTAISAWYIITTSKIRWYGAFLAFAVGAAYIHVYAGLVVAIGYSLLLYYTLKYDQTKIIKLLALVPIAILLYLPCLLKFIEIFSQPSGELLWIKPLTLGTIAGYAKFIFRAGPLTPVFFSLFFIVFYIFLVRTKTQKELFAFCCLSCIVILASIGILASIIIHPIFINRYLFPACGLVWLFFAIICGSIKNMRAFVLICSILLALGFSTFSSSLYKAKKDNINFVQFHEYLKEHMTPQDVFIYPQECIHMRGIIAYLFPGHIHIMKKIPNNAFLQDVFCKDMMTFDSLNDTDKFYGRRGWIIINDATNAPKYDSDVFLSNNAIFRRNFGWRRYRFKLFYTENLTDFASP